MAKVFEGAPTKVQYRYFADKFKQQPKAPVFKTLHVFEVPGEHWSNFDTAD